MPGAGGLASAGNIIGYIGAGIVIAAYFLNQKAALRSDDWRFPALNLAGSLMVITSLGFNPNPPSIVIEAFWTSISLYGLRRSLRKRSS